MTSEQDDSQYIISSVQRALRLLRLFEHKNTKLSLMEVCKAMSLNKATAFRLLVTLCDEGFLERDEVTNKYGLGVTVCNLGSSFFASMNIRDIALPVLHRLANQSQLIVHFVIKSQDDRLIVIEKIAPDEAGFLHNLTSLRGGELPMHCTGIGKIFLANMSPDKARAFLEKGPLTKFTASTETDADAIMASLPAIAEQGYATCLNEHEGYASSVGCAIRDYTGEICAGISAGGISEMCNDIGMDKVIAMVMAAAGEISSSLGYRGK